LCVATHYNPNDPPSKTRIKQTWYSFVHKISTRHPSKNGLRPLWWSRPQVGNYYTWPSWLIRELKATDIDCKLELINFKKALDSSETRNTKMRLFSNRNIRKRSKMLSAAHAEQHFTVLRLVFKPDKRLWHVLSQLKAVAKVVHEWQRDTTNCVMRYHCPISAILRSHTEMFQPGTHKDKSSTGKRRKMKVDARAEHWVKPTSTTYKYEQNTRKPGVTNLRLASRSLPGFMRLLRNCQKSH